MTASWLGINSPFHFPEHVYRVPVRSQESQQVCFVLGFLSFWSVWSVGVKVKKKEKKHFLCKKPQFSLTNLAL